MTNQLTLGSCAFAEIGYDAVAQSQQPRPDINALNTADLQDPCRLAQIFVQALSHQGWTVTLGQRETFKADARQASQSQDRQAALGKFIKQYTRKNENAKSEVSQMAAFGENGSNAND